MGLYRKYTLSLSTNVSFQYDANGNLTNDGLRSFQYDDENQLISVWANNAWKSDFTYDGLHRRRAETNSVWNGGGWAKSSERRFVYDGNLVIEERDVNNQSQVFYTRGRDLSGTFAQAGGIGGLLARTPSSDYLRSSSAAHAFFFSDGNGNVTMLISTNQLVLAKYLYDSFGRTLSQSGPLAAVNVYRFSTKEVHVSSGLIDFGLRFYDPNLQQWVNRDPIAENGGLNLFSYVGNNPLGYIDPLGLAEGDFKSTAINNALKATGSTSTYKDLVPEKGTPLKFDPNTKKYLRFDLDASHKDPNIHFFDSLKDAKKNKTSCKVFVNAKTAAVKTLTFATLSITFATAINAIADNPNYRAALEAAKAGNKAGVDDALFELSVDISIETGSTVPFYTINSTIK